MLTKILFKIFFRDFTNLKNKYLEIKLNQLLSSDILFINKTKLLNSIICILCATCDEFLKILLTYIRT